ncbi:MAG: ABC transporter permease [Candidatus Methanomethylicota archaeon]|uniref:ABC transporter permease n=1 Tax=Thermoproteota archaeon TaxID=2056631 RepID=A0A497EVF7_9CREN|nr:MAG: ABC transporter permease [Candidatus Verstraetearchaeota archaeon]
MIEIKLEKRPPPSKIEALIYSKISVAFALFVSGVILKVYGVDPVEAYKIIAFNVFGSIPGISETIVKLIPLALCGVGLTVAYRAKIWNIGAEGQLLLGAIAATGVALFTGDLPPYLLVPLMFLAGFAAGAMWGAIPAFLKAFFNVNEVIVTTMMNYIAIELVRYLIYGPWRGSKEWGYPITDEIPDAAKLICIPGTRIHIATLILAIASSILVYILITRTTFGFEIRVAGGNPEAAKYAGISYVKVVLLSMIISGGLAGLAGTGEIAGIHYRLRYPESISMGYGFTAIIVAWLARLNPILVIVTSLFFGGLLVGGYVMKMMLGLPVAMVNIFNGATLLSVLLCELMLQYKVKLKIERRKLT